MSEVWFTSDLHLGHAKVLSFEKSRRPFDDVEEHDQTIMDNWSSVVAKRDVVWVLGDIAWTGEALSKIGSLPGRKKLVLGNHDEMSAHEYLRVFEDLYGVVKWKRGVCITHVPIHPAQFYRWSVNIHGHLHNDHVRIEQPDQWVPGHVPATIPDERYINVCLEQNNLFPFAWEDLKKRIPENA